MTYSIMAPILSLLGQSWLSSYSSLKYSESNVQPEHQQERRQNRSESFTKSNDDVIEYFWILGSHFKYIFNNGATKDYI